MSIAVPIVESTTAPSWVSKELHNRPTGTILLDSPGPTLAKEAQVLLKKWQNRGLRPDVLAAIRFEVFSVPAPTP